ncbi:MAG: diguanylate cyclase [Gammaproteobacteria bacterium]|jgi:diguanylate cyclase (GGDEF)-like protein|nr:diguanylate cyclase [Gammaproteobacteria bacterium]
MMGPKGPEFAGIFRFGVRQKVILVLVLVLIGAMSLSGWLLYRSQRAQVEQEILHNSEVIMDYVSKSLAFSVVGYDYHTIQLHLEQLIAFEDIVYAQVLSPKGNVMAEVGARPHNEPGAELIGTDIVLNGEAIGRLALGISNTRIIEKLDVQRDQLITRELLIIVLIAIGEFVALSWIIIRPVTRISRGMTATVNESGTIDQGIQIDSHDEFGDMASRFNLLRDRLNDANARLQSRIQMADRKLEDTNQELLRANEELKRIALTDGLTGLFNRRHFESLLRSEVQSSLRYGDSYSLILLDLDHFKEVNDRFGHDVGDDVLRQVATLIQDIVRNTDVVCRIGGEEFVVLCRHADRAAAVAAAEKIRARLEATHLQTAAGDVRLTTSAGVATIPDPGTQQDAREFLKNADRALYRSKKQGRNRVTHYNEIELEAHQ